MIFDAAKAGVRFTLCVFAMKKATVISESLRLPLKDTGLLTR
jgi:predicted peroxiredoxin